ncbi:MAG: hypothetical protein FWG92_06550, partial [Leptospirales bacterium]|nr:hypothetical protein [Leptospirales bacterium]
MSIINEAVFEKNALQYVKNAIKLEEPVIVATDDGNAVIINETIFRSLRETAYLNSIPGMAESIIEGTNTPWEECVV